MSLINNPVDQDNEEFYRLADLQKKLTAVTQSTATNGQTISGDDAGMDQLMGEAAATLSDLTKWHVEIRNVLFEQDRGG